MSAARLGIEPAALATALRAALFERRVVEEGIRSCVEGSRRPAGTAAAGPRASTWISPLFEPAQQFLQAIDVHGLVQAVPQSLFDERDGRDLART
jgi:hypothetical protein